MHGNLRLKKTTFMTTLLGAGLASSAWAAPTVPKAPEAQPRLAILPIGVGAGLTQPIVSGFEAQLRQKLAQTVTVIEAAAVQQALSGQQDTETCASPGCQEALAKGAQARFILQAQISNSDEIYTVQLNLTDLNLKQQASAREICELCTIDEAKVSLEKAAQSLTPALQKAPVVKVSVASPESKASRSVFKVVTDPPGAQIFVGEALLGRSPYVGSLPVGQHEVRLVSEGHVVETIPVHAMGEPLAIERTLRKAQGAAVVPVAAPKAEPLAVDPPVAAVGEGPQLMGWAIGTGVGGAVLTGVGIWLIALDGDVTCDDGRNHQECPSVYNTKYLGAAGLGLGAGLIGAAVTMIVWDRTGASSAPSVAPAPNGAGAVLQWGGAF